MNKLCLDPTPPIATPPCNLGGVGEFLFIYFRKPFMNLRVQQLPWPARSPDLLPIDYEWDMMKWDIILSSEPATTITELRYQMQKA